MARAVEIANEFLKLADASGKLTQMQLQKLTFIADGWSWVINGNDLVKDMAEAWSYGPVFPDLYNHTKFFGADAIPKGRLITPDDSSMHFFDGNSVEVAPYKADIEQGEKSVIEHVWSRYGNVSGIELSKMTHQPGTPWFNAFRRGKNSQIRTDDIIAHYEALANHAEKAA